jgi:hypothetical protein
MSFAVIAAESESNSSGLLSEKGDCCVPFVYIDPWLFNIEIGSRHAYMKNMEQSRVYGA